MSKARKKQKLSSSQAKADPLPEKSESALIVLKSIKTAVTDTTLVVVGTYERLLYGFEVTNSEDPSELKISPKFIMPIHIGYISTLSLCSKFLASGSTDEVIKLFDIKRKKELGSLHEHTGTITKVQFFGTSHLLSASSDGSIIIYRTKDWEVLKVLRGHLKQVNDIAIHPSGKLAISISKDRSAIVWNLLTGHKVSRTKLLLEGELVRFNQSGDLYSIVSSNSQIITYDISKGKEISTYSATSKILDGTFIKFSDDNEYFMFGAADKSLHLLDANTGKEVFYFKAHDNSFNKALSTKAK
ncbi:hypothetical protein BB561_002145 [Smittium simulii]|uniref:Uncharacterized protein n=1 Tax=Smittium simulii TaxID=133385 RepID=A0A2T9YRJ0_9FUNG|nr:hypothetical protein BB561_002145 [Smittium simulii]